MAIAGDNRLFEMRMERSFRRGQKARAEQHARGAQGQRRRQSTSIGDAASRHEICACERFLQHKSLGKQSDEPSRQ